MTYDEHVDERGRLVVPVGRAMDPAPRRPGWVPWWVNVNLDRDPQKLVTYKREPRAGGIPGDGWAPGRTVEISD